MIATKTEAPSNFNWASQLRFELKEVAEELGQSQSNSSPIGNSKPEALGSSAPSSPKPGPIGNTNRQYNTQKNPISPIPLSKIFRFFKDVYEKGASAILTGRYIRSTFIEDQEEFMEHLQIGKQIGKFVDMPKRPQAPKPMLFSGGGKI